MIEEKEKDAWLQWVFSRAAGISNGVFQRGKICLISSIASWSDMMGIVKDTLWTNLKAYP